MSVNPQWSYDVISILQDGGRGVANQLPVACLVIELKPLRRSRPICIPNFSEISQSTAELLILNSPCYDTFRTLSLRKKVCQAKKADILEMHTKHHTEYLHIEYLFQPHLHFVAA